jgi:hypothetical protein
MVDFQRYIGCLLLCLSACTVHVPPKHISGVVRERDNGELLAGVEVSWMDGERVWRRDTTGPLGYFTASTKELERGCPQGPFTSPGCRIVLRKQDGERLLTDTLRIGPFVAFHESFLDVASITPKAIPPVADMHYHVTMRAQNALGQALYDDEMKGQDVDHTVLWFKRLQGIRVPHRGRWWGVPSGNEDWLRRTARRADRTQACDGPCRRLRMALEGSARLARKGNNKVTHYTQATLPHVMRGHVMLGYNAISPFEHNLNDRPYKRMIGTTMKSGIASHWLRRIGKDDDHESWAMRQLHRLGIGRPSQPPITHWANFKSEYELFSAQDTAYGNTSWSRYHDPRQLPKGTQRTPVFVAVVEGGHAVQDSLFPNNVGYDIEHRTDVQQDTLKNWVLRRFPKSDPRVVRLTADSVSDTEKRMVTTITTAKETAQRANQVERSASEVWIARQRTQGDSLLKAMNRPMRRRSGCMSSGSACGTIRWKHVGRP